MIDDLTILPRYFKTNYIKYELKRKKRIQEQSIFKAIFYFVDLEMTFTLKRSVKYMYANMKYSLK